MLNSFSKIPTKFFAYVFKTRVGFEIAEITKFQNYFSSYSFAL